MHFAPAINPASGNKRCKFAGRLTGLILALALNAVLWRPAAADQDKVFMFPARGIRDLNEFRTYAELAARMKAHGRVQIAISSLADKAWFIYPEGGSPWHEYACYMPAPWMFFPHPKIAPFVPADWVAANRRFLLAKAAIARELGLEMIFSGKNSEMLPEAFFQKYPELRGPRVDHPRRSTREEFSWCVDLPETREIIEWTMAELLRNVPEIKTFMSGTNDAGSGLCWAEAQYPGPNGPAHCQGRTAGERVRDLVLAVQEGARKGGGDIVFRWSNVNFWRNEMDVVLPLLPENAFIDSRDRSRMGVGTLINDNYPFTGIIDPLAVIQSMERYGRPGTKIVSVGYSAMYDRYEDRPGTVAKLLDLVEQCMEEPGGSLFERLEKLRKVAALWGGEKNKERVFEAFYNMHEAFSLKNSVAPDYSNFYCGVSMRHLTRPLLIKPELLTPEEESYFLPHVFNIRENEARMDYTDLHGGRRAGTASWNDGGLRRALGMATGAARTLERLEDAPEGPFLKDIGLALRMWAGEVRSINNFFHAQLIRDKNAEILAGPKRIPAKVGTWEGDPGNLEWNEIMRDELDNTNELIEMLENGGMKLVACAKDPRYEDTFLLGPDLINQLKKKAKIMREHWLDIQDYLAPPHK
ncbi:MAG: hypothetical protein A2Z86_08865 [Candidatus Glassbacteria bacterium GWA2_58_10]|uniref:Uncharacterized protein n=1 Tax=Candidatus Glassbacteria bacterium GWA2_58_10 TaxID=1817865 RepID=A0A1F5YE09_9BACT|nr:MAG: hypothetical protein A2Z86_08865 [Candidatus Glassbacteria bacterium GWA2_58_10]